MIDTIEFRIHNLGRHLALQNFLHKELTNSGKTVKMIRDDDQPTPVQKMLFRTQLQFHDTGNVQDVAHFNKLKSSHYEIAYKIDYLRDYIAFNVSVPKYIYGTNILLYVRHSSSPSFEMAKHVSVKHNLRNAYKRMLTFFDTFFTSEFHEIYIDKREVEINRVDLCYNQVFLSKEDAFEYLKQLKKVKKKYSRDTSNFSRDWKTSIVYRTDRYSFKVYHKGSEFRKHDAKRLKEINEQGGKPFDVEHYQAFADKILRYEITFRNSYMSYLYMYNLFRRECPIWQHALGLWKTYKNAKQKKADEFMKHRKSLTIDDKQHIDYVDLFINRCKKFYLADADAGTKWQYFDWETNPADLGASRPPRFRQSAHFSSDLMRLMGRKFLKLLDEFKLDVAQDNHSILSNLERHNKEIREQQRLAKSLGEKVDSRVTRAISVSKIKMLLNLLDNHTFEEIEAENMFSRNTWLNLRNDLALLGVTKNSLLGFNLNVAFDLANYHHEVLMHSYKYRHLTR